MSQKKIVVYFIMSTILLLASLPLLNTFFLYSNGTLDLKNFNKKQLFTTDNIESKLNYIFYKSFKVSLNKELVIVGKHDFLFLGNKYAKVMDKTQGEFPYTQKDIDLWTDKLKQLQDWYETRNIKFAIIVPANKHSIYNDFLPDYKKSRTITDDIVKFCIKKKIHILDLRSIIRSHIKKDALLYFKSDTHWNKYGAFIGFKETIKYLNNTLNTNYTLPKYDAVTSYPRSSGDLANFLKITNLLPNDYETDYAFHFKKNNKVCIGDIDKKNYKVEKCIIKDNLDMDSIHPQYMINEKALSNDKLLLLCDSFGTAHSQFYNRTFETIWKMHYDHINGENLVNFINANNPNIVIYQILERRLYNFNMLQTLPEVSITNKYDNTNDLIFDIHKNNTFTVNKDLQINQNILKVTGNDPTIIINNLPINTLKVILNCNISSNIDTFFQIFYKQNDIAKGYNEEDSFRVKIKKGNNQISLMIPSKYIKNSLRIDPAGNEGNYTLNELTIYSFR